MFSIINDYKIAGISLFSSCSSPRSSPRCSFRHVPLSHCDISSGGDGYADSASFRIRPSSPVAVYIAWTHLAPPPVSRSGAMMTKSPNSIQRANRLLSSNIRRAGKSTDRYIHRNPPRCPYRRSSRDRPCPSSSSPSSSRRLSRSGTSRRTRLESRPPQPAPSIRRTGRRAGRFATSRTPI